MNTPDPGSKTLSAPQKALRKLGLNRDIDLALHLPLRYEDETRITPLRQAREGEPVQIEGVVTDCEVVYRPRRQLLVTLDDGTDRCLLRFFNFYPSQQKALAVGQRVRARGELRGGLGGWTLLHPQCRAARGQLPSALTPIYPSVAGLPQAYLRKAVQAGLARADLQDTFAPQIPRQIGNSPLWDLKTSLSFLHQPAPEVSLVTLQDRSHPAWLRLKAEELLAQQLSQLQARRERAALRAPVLANPGQAAGDSLHARLLAVLPFRLTQAQQRVEAEIAADMARATPMHRLLQGDVGAGKTVVAALAASRCIDAGWQCALMAPTEILAEQHFRKLVGWLEPLGLKVAWLTGSQKKKERHAMLALIESGQAGLVVGTHAVIQAQVRFKALALAIIDEQHRFGVAQRLALRAKTQTSPEGSDITNALAAPHGSGATSKAHPPHETCNAHEPPKQCDAGEARDGPEPHLLMMTATPIPRTLAMSYYADLDVSTLDELPPGRSPVLTKLLHNARRPELIERMRGQLAQGRQVYWVCPLIEESEALDLSNATALHAELSAALNTAGSSVQVGLLHSRMPLAQKRAVMQEFVQGHLGLLVSTTVIEVGVDVPNATLMVVEHAERFGLSQLHQLRGRVGRGSAASVCVLLYDTGDAPRLSPAARERLKAMVETQDGFEIARRDLEIRGPGEFLGARQSGAALLRFADLSIDGPLLAWAQTWAARMWQSHPELARRHLARWLGNRTDYLKA